jgi:flagellar hook-basal body complex protein FliE
MLSPTSLASPLATVSPIFPASVATGEGSFSDAIGAAMSQVETAQTTARQAGADLLTGGQGDVHTVALAAQKAELSLELFQQVRNKFVQAYQEIMKMPM